MNEACLQESPERKAEWLSDAQTRIPVGTRVRVVRDNCGEDLYVGLVGTVVGYDLGVNGEWPLVRVQLDEYDHDGGSIDGFHCDGHGAKDDEIEALTW